MQRIAAPRLEDVPDEVLDGTPGVRARYESILDGIASRGPAAVARRVQGAMGAGGACFRVDDGRQPFRVDPVPRLLSGAEWGELERGLAQMARALEAFVRDVYGDRRIVAAGALPERVIATSALYDASLRGVEVPGGYVFVYGPDLVRGADGRLRVLEDNLRTPSGIAYLLALDDALRRELGADLDGLEGPDHELRALTGALRLAAPEGSGDEPQVVVLSDGPGSPAYYEHCEIARRIGVQTATPDELELRGEALVRRDDEGRARPVDVVYRRTDEAALRKPDGAPTGLTETLGPAVRAGTVGVANAFGAGIADDKLTHAYAETLIRFYLDEEPLIESVRTLDLADGRQRAEALERINELVVKERHRAGGVGVIVEPDEESDGVEGVRRAIAQRGEELIAQERITLSTHPTVAGGGFEPRRVDLRPFLFRTPSGWEAMPGGLTRFAASPESLVVNSTQGGGGKNTLILR